MNRAVPFVLGIAILSGFVCGCGPPPEWEQEVLFEASRKLGGCALGDLDPELPGDEIAVVGADGSVLLLRASAPGTKADHELLAKLPGEPIQCATGDYLPDVPGDELVCVGAKLGGEDDGSPGVAVLFHRKEGSWTHQVILEDERLLHAVAIGDVDPDRSGVEILVAGYTNKAWLLTGPPDAIVVTELGPLPGPAKGAAIAPGRSYVACADGSLVGFVQEDDGFVRQDLAKIGDALARIAATEDAVLVCANDGILRLYLDGDFSRADSVLKSSNRLRGAVIDDLTSTHPGLEIATAGYDGLVHMLTPLREDEPDSRTPVLVGSDTDRFHHLASGTLPQRGRVLIGCGYSGRVLCFREGP